MPLVQTCGSRSGRPAQNCGPLYEDVIPNYFIPAEGQAFPDFLLRDENPWADSEEEDDVNTGSNSLIN